MLSFLERVFGKSRIEKDVDRTHKMPSDLLGFADFEDYVGDDGVVRQKLVFRTDYTPDKSLTLADFALQNLLASGIKPEMVGSLNQAPLTEADKAVDQMEAIVESTKNSVSHE